MGWKCELCGAHLLYEFSYSRHLRNVHHVRDDKVKVVKTLGGGTEVEKRKEPEPSTSKEPSPSPKRRRTQRRGYKEVDSMEPVDLPEGEDEITEGVRNVMKKRWSMIKTGHRLNNKLQDIYNYRMRECNVTHLLLVTYFEERYF